MFTCFSRIFKNVLGHDEWVSKVKRRLLNRIDFVQAEARYHHACHGKFYVSEGLSPPLTRNPLGRQANKESAGCFNKLCSYIESETEVYSLQELQAKMIEVAGGENEYIKFIQRNGLKQNYNKSSVTRLF